jgi:hypothetical protein
MRRWLNFLPWAAAISLAAFAASAVYASRFALIHLIMGSAHRLPTVTTMLPVSLGACLVVGVPLAIWFRGSRAWAMTLLLVIIGAVVLGTVLAVGTYYKGATGEAAGWLTMIALFWIVPLGLAFLLPALALLVFVSLPTGALVLFLSGEMKAIRQRVSVLDLRYGRLRVGLLVALTAAPALAYAPLPRLLHGEEYEACRTAPPSAALKSRGLQLFVDLDSPDWPELKQIVERYAAGHDLRLLPSDMFKQGDPFHYRLCAPGKFALFFYTTQDYGAPSLIFEPTGERFVAITAFVGATDEAAGAALRDLATLVDARWPGVRLQTAMDLGPSLKPERPGSGACRTKVVRPKYQDCLGSREPATVHKEALYVHSQRSDGLRLREVMRAFADEHGMAFTLKKDAHDLGRSCAKGKALIVAEGFLDLKPPVRQPGWWHVQIDTYLADESDGPLIDDLVAALDAEWPGVMRSRPDINFCRAMKGGR